MGEKAFKTMQGAGASNIVIGVVLLVVGVAAGVITIVHGARLLINKNEITF
ncbi:hypothetical protein [Hespellia stercorisuis]|uniref:Uncharacterized protein n=1 Tax=Hespellia stercorisuis DSM 15480 TaxID=1121950 RepID=A0A1M6T116_9FIRM|nr:hypothetical protein [Hespellia stercorisuis]SHK50624.1 hypothetical protein SAMN02745243_03096 [Hespellia stercorisuis DSM 15480]